MKFKLLGYIVCCLLVLSFITGCDADNSGIEITEKNVASGEKTVQGVSGDATDNSGVTTKTNDLQDWSKINNSSSSGIDSLSGDDDLRNEKAEETKKNDSFKVKTSVKSNNNGVVKDKNAKGTTKITATQNVVKEKVSFITIECLEVLDNKDKLKDGHLQLIPSDGFLIRKTGVDFKEGQSVYDYLVAVCEKNGLEINSSKSFLGVYIKGIGGLDERDCGNTSGWIVKVNGVSITKSVDKIIINEDDEIVFSFVTSL